MDGLFEIVNPLSLVLHLVNLVILYIVFKKFLYKPVAKFLKDRQDKLHRSARPLIRTARK